MSFNGPLNVVRPVPLAQMVERPLREREVVGSIPGRAIPKAFKMVPVVTLLGAQHYGSWTPRPKTISARDSSAQIDFFYWDSSARDSSAQL